MRKGITVRLTGANVEATTKALATRLLELGRPVEVVDEALAARLGGAGGAALVCRLLSRNGIIVLATYAGTDPEGDHVEAEIDAHDTPEFAAEKAIDALAEEGYVSLETSDYSPEEEEEIRKRLSDLGYIE